MKITILKSVSLIIFSAILHFNLASNALGSDLQLDKTAFSGTVACPYGGCGRWDYIFSIYKTETNHRKAIFNFKKVDGFGRSSYGSVNSQGTYNAKARTFVFTELFEPHGEALRKEVLTLPFSCTLNENGSQLTINSNKANRYFRSTATRVALNTESYYVTPSIPSDILPAASVNGAYSELAQKIKCDRENSADISEFGHSSEGFFCNQKKIAGYGVWVKPYLYIWAVRNEKLLKEAQYKQAIAYRDQLIEDYQEKVHADSNLRTLDEKFHLIDFYSNCLKDVSKKHSLNLVTTDFNTCKNALRQKQQDAVTKVRHRKNEYDRQLTRIQFETTKYNTYWKSIEGAKRLQQYPVQQSLPQCFQQAITEKGDLLTRNDLDICIHQYNAHIGHIKSEESKIIRTREAEEQRKREKGQLAVFRNNLYLAAENSPEDVLKAAKIINIEFIRTIKIGGNRVDIYDTSQTNAMAPIAYATFTKQGKVFKKELLASIIFWVLPPEDSQAVELMGSMGPLGLLGLAQIASDRNKFQEDLRKKFGPPSTIDNFKATDLEEDRVNPLAFLLSGSLSGLLSGNNNTVWIRDGGKTLLALQNARTLHPLLMHNLPRIYDDFKVAAVKGLEFINVDLYEKVTKNSSEKASMDF